MLGFIIKPFLKRGLFLFQAQSILELMQDKKKDSGREEESRKNNQTNVPCLWIYYARRFQTEEAQVNKSYKKI